MQNVRHEVTSCCDAPSPHSVKLSEVKLAFGVSDHVPECHKTEEGLDHSGHTQKTHVNKWQYQHEKYIYTLFRRKQYNYIGFEKQWDHTCVNMKMARTMWTPLSKGWMRRSSLRSWNRISGNCSRMLSSQNPANSGTFHRHRH